MTIRTTRLKASQAPKVDALDLSNQMNGRTQTFSLPRKVYNFDRHYLVWNSTVYNNDANHTYYTISSDGLSLTTHFDQAPIAGPGRTLQLVVDMGGDSTDNVPTIGDVEHLVELEAQEREKADLQEGMARADADAALAKQIEAEVAKREEDVENLISTITKETTERISEDEKLAKTVEGLSEEDKNLQEQIDAINNASDVKDVVQDHKTLDKYDKKSLTDNDVIKVLKDEEHENATTYYRYQKNSDIFDYIGATGPYVTVAEGAEIRKDAEAAKASAEEAVSKIDKAVETINEAVAQVEDKQEKLVSGENIKTINGEDILGDGNVEILGGVPGTVIAVLDNHSLLAEYDTSEVKKNDVIEVLNDETKEGITTFYRWSENSGFGDNLLEGMDYIGGGIDHYFVGGKLTNCTVTTPQSGSGGGGMYIMKNESYDTWFTLEKDKNYIFTFKRVDAEPTGAYTELSGGWDDMGERYTLYDDGTPVEVTTFRREGDYHDYTETMPITWSWYYPGNWQNGATYEFGVYEVQNEAKNSNDPDELSWNYIGTINANGGGLDFSSDLVDAGLNNKIVKSSSYNNSTPVGLIIGKDNSLLNDAYDGDKPYLVVGSENLYDGYGMGFGMNDYPAVLIFGDKNHMQNSDSLIFGHSNNVDGETYAFGRKNTTKQGGIVAGYENELSGWAVGIGARNTGIATYSVAVGLDNNLAGTGTAMSIGTSNTHSNNHQITIGYSLHPTRENEMRIGYESMYYAGNAGYKYQPYPYILSNVGKGEEDEDAVNLLQMNQTLENNTPKVFNTAAEMQALERVLLANNTIAFVLADENHGGKPSMYCFSRSYEGGDAIEEGALDINIDTSYWRGANIMRTYYGLGMNSSGAMASGGHTTVATVVDKGTTTRATGYTVFMRYLNDSYNSAFYINGGTLSRKWARSSDGVVYYSTGASKVVGGKLQVVAIKGSFSSQEELGTWNYLGSLGGND